MTRTEHLLVCLMEECNEVAQRASKALRFGVTEVQPGQDKTNAERIKGEMIDLFAAYGLLCREGVCVPIAPMDGPAVEAKQEKIEGFLDYSRECGTLTTSPT